MKGYTLDISASLILEEAKNTTFFLMKINSLASF